MPSFDALPCAVHGLRSRRSSTFKTFLDSQKVNKENCSSKLSKEECSNSLHRFNYLPMWEVDSSPRMVTKIAARHATELYSQAFHRRFTCLDAWNSSLFVWDEWDSREISWNKEKDDKEWEWIVSLRRDRAVIGPLCHSDGVGQMVSSPACPSWYGPGW